MHKYCTLLLLSGLFDYYTCIYHQSSHVQFIYIIILYFLVLQIQDYVVLDITKVKLSSIGVYI